MKIKFHTRRTGILAIISMVMMFLFACAGGKTNNSTVDPNPTQEPYRAPANNEKPDLIDPDSKFKDVAVYDKFGAWPSKTGDEYFTSEVGTWFTVWWTGPSDSTFSHWYDVNWTRLKPVDYGYYSTNDEDYLTSAFARLKYIGIDFLMLDDTNGHWNDFGLIARNMRRCFKVADSMNGFAPQIAIATGAPVRDGDTAQQAKELDEYYKQYYLKYPEVFYKYEDKPLVLMYLAEKANARHIDDRYTIRYGTGFVSWQSLAVDQTIFKTQGNWGWVFDIQNEGSEVMGVQPGYNKAAQGVTIESFPREGGKRYISMWLAAIKANPNVIIIPSYNDHAEETGWEATTPIRDPQPGGAPDTPGEDPYLYEKITEAYMALRYGYIEGFYYQEENKAQIYRCQDGYLRPSSEPESEPVIIIPEGYIEWELNRNRG